MTPVTRLAATATVASKAETVSPDANVILLTFAIVCCMPLVEGLFEAVFTKSPKLVSNSPRSFVERLDKAAALSAERIPKSPLSIALIVFTASSRTPVFLISMSCCAAFCRDSMSSDFSISLAILVVSIPRSSSSLTAAFREL